MPNTRCNLPFVRANYISQLVYFTQTLLVRVYISFMLRLFLGVQTWFSKQFTRNLGI